VTTLADASAIYVGTTQAVAVYAGDVKVWPVKSYTAVWINGIAGQPGLLKLCFPTVVANDTYTVDVPPGPTTLAHPEYTLGVNGNLGDVAPRVYFSTDPAEPPANVSPSQFRGMTNGEAVTTFGGMRLTVTRVSTFVTALVIVGPVP
jgi:hypothetical protein